ncbi:hypothetical protein PMAYCL1PPCAC_28762, partial [Pristionchus mayeri]
VMATPALAINTHQPIKGESRDCPSCHKIFSSEDKLRIHFRSFPQCDPKKRRVSVERKTGRCHSPRLIVHRRSHRQHPHGCHSSQKPSYLSPHSKFVLNKDAKLRHPSSNGKMELKILYCTQC